MRFAIFVSLVILVSLFSLAGAQECEINSQCNGGICEGGICIETANEHEQPTYNYNTPEGQWTKTQETEFVAVQSCSIVEGGSPATRTTISAVSTEDGENTLTSEYSNEVLNYFSCAISGDNVAVAWDVLACSYGASASDDSCRTEQATECQEGYTRQPDGTCAAETQIVCEDTDNGINYNEKGVASVINTATGSSSPVGVDYCSDDGKLVEHYCDPESAELPVKSLFYNCGEGFSCVDGACKSGITSTSYPKLEASEIAYPTFSMTGSAEPEQPSEITKQKSFLDILIELLLKPFTILLQANHDWMEPYTSPKAGCSPAGSVLGNCLDKSGWLFNYCEYDYCGNQRQKTKESSFWTPCNGVKGCYQYGTGNNQQPENGESSSGLNGDSIDNIEDIRPIGEPDKANTNQALTYCYLCFEVHGYPPIGTTFELVSKLESSENSADDFCQGRFTDSNKFYQFRYKTSDLSWCQVENINEFEKKFGEFYPTEKQLDTKFTEDYKTFE